MSRIQHALDKADREGGVLRMRSMIEPAATAALAFETPRGATSRAGEAGDAGEEEIAAERAVPTLTPGQTVRGAELDPILRAALAPGTVVAEQYRSLRTRVAHIDHAAPINVILVTSPGRREGKSLTAANLGLTMAQDFQRRICVVDADLRHSKLHTLFGLSEGPGLADVLAGRATLADALIDLEDHQITLLPAGQIPAHPAELLGSSAMRRTIQTLRSQFDRVIVDAPPTAPLADIGILTPLVDSVLLVVRAGVTTKPAIEEAMVTIGTAKLLGAVLNDVASRA
jgi:capsular exopolysaccharide synthesis family protein